MLEWLKKSLKENHIAQMAVCCFLPVVVIIALQLAGFTGVWVYVLAFAVCIGSHLIIGYFASKEGKKTCH